MVEAQNEDGLIIHIQLSLEDGDEMQLDQLTRGLREEIQELEVESAELASGGQTPEGAMAGMDPVLLGVVLVTVGPTVLTHFLEFLHDWAMRREGRKLKVRIETPEGSAVEIEVPETTSREELIQWIETVRAALPKAKRSKKY